MSQPAPAPGSSPRLALAAGFGCYLIWGFAPLLFQLVGRLGATPWEILAHRTVWAIPPAMLFVWMARQGGQTLAVLRDPRTLAWLALSSALIATNWGVFIWAVNHGRLLETSLGYYINPLVMMAAGAVMFRERVDGATKAAMALAGLGVAIQAVALGRLPMVALILAFSFAGYGIVRRRVKADAQTGLLVECLILGLPGMAYVALLQANGQGHAFHAPALTFWLMAAGPITAAPLVLFSWAARRMTFAALGFLQFLAPTISFFIGLSQGEPFSNLRAVSFACIWGGAAVFILAMLRKTQAARAATPQPSEA